MKNTNPERRHFLRAAGIGLALPFLETFASRSALAGAGPRRLVVWHVHDGVIPDAWFPLGEAGQPATETSWQLNTIMKALAPYKARTSVFKGIYSCGTGFEHDLTVCMTGLPRKYKGVVRNKNSADYSRHGLGYEVSSLDQVIGHALQGSAPFPTLEFAVRPGRTDYRMLFWKNLFVPSEGDPNAMFARMFGGGGQAGASPEADRAFQALQAQRRSVLDAVAAEYAALLPRVSASDRQRLESYATSLRSVEKRLAALGASRSCGKPAGKALPAAAARYDEIGAAQVELLALALRCNLAPVMTLKWHVSVGGEDYRWLLGTGHQHHDMGHGWNKEPTRGAYVKVLTWYMERFASLLDMATGGPAGPGSLLDDTIFMWQSNFGTGGHSGQDLPFVLVGSAGGLRTGRYFQYQDTGQDPENNRIGHPHRKLWNSILTEMGVRLPEGPEAYGDKLLPGLGP